PIAYSPHGLPQFQECIGIKIFDPPPVAFQDSCGNPVVFEIIAWLQMSGMRYIGLKNLGHFNLQSTPFSNSAKIDFPALRVL
ncbi:MAG: hypothetical protein V5783_07530, partial [Pontiella sp.]